MLHRVIGKFKDNNENFKHKVLGITIVIKTPNNAALNSKHSEKDVSRLEPGIHIRI